VSARFIIDSRFFTSMRDVFETPASRKYALETPAHLHDFSAHLITLLGVVEFEVSQCEALKRDSHYEK
jgi:hypothetical protein